MNVVGAAVKNQIDLIKTTNLDPDATLLNRGACFDFTGEAKMGLADQSRRLR